MRPDVDIYLGLLAWVVAIHVAILRFLPEVEYQMLLGVVLVPATWLVIIIMMIVRRRRKLRYLCWVWPSALIVLFYPVMFVYGMAVVCDFAP